MSPLWGPVDIKALDSDQAITKTMEITNGQLVHSLAS